KSIKLQRGQDALVEKRRVELADALDRGNVMMAHAGAPPASPSMPIGGAGPTPPGSSPDPITALINRAQSMADVLPANIQAELSDTLAQLIMARENRNQREQTNAVLRLTSILDRYRPN